jgi:hypothetical protein
MALQNQYFFTSVAGEQCSRRKAADAGADYDSIPLVLKSLLFVRKHGFPPLVDNGHIPN